MHILPQPGTETIKILYKSPNLDFLEWYVPLMGSKAACINLQIEGAVNYE